MGGVGIIGLLAILLCGAVLIGAIATIVYVLATRNRTR